MSTNNLNVVNANHFFDALNKKRKTNQQEEIENSLLARKLGILFAIKTDNYVNFKGEFIELNDYQLEALYDILDEYFNVELRQEVQQLIMSTDELRRKIETEEVFLTSHPQGNLGSKKLMSKIKGFFGMRA